MSEQTEETQVYTVTAPDGSKMSVRGPVGATDEEIIKFAQSQYKPAAKPAGKPPKDEASERAWQKFTKDIEQADVPDEVKQATIARARELGQKFPVYTGTKQQSMGDALREQLAELERQYMVPLVGEKPMSPQAANLAQLGVTGASALTGYAMSPKIAAGIERVAEASQRPMFARPGTAPVTPPVPPSGGPMTSGEKWAANWAGQERPGVGGVPEASAAYQRGKGQGKVTGELSKRFGPAAFAPVEPGVYQGSMVDRLIERGRQAEAAARQAEAAAREAASPLNRVSQMFGTIGRTGANLLGDVLRSRAMGALGAGSAAYQGIEALKHLKAGRDEEAALSGLGALGGGLMAIPTLPTAVVGGALTAAPYLYRAAKRATPEQTQQMLTNVNPMGDFAP